MLKHPAAKSWSAFSARAMTITKPFCRCAASTANLNQKQRPQNLDAELDSR